MDDYKRTIYMEVLRKLQEKPSYTFICLELHHTLFDNQDEDLTDTADSILTEFFPEFAALFDGTMWFKNNRCWGIEITRSMGWWEDWWYEPRIRALECILRDSA